MVEPTQQVSLPSDPEREVSNPQTPSETGVGPQELASSSETKAEESVSKPTLPKLTVDFPKDTLDFALRAPRALEEKNAGRPLPPAELKTALGINADSMLRRIIAASSRFDLTVGTSTSTVITLTETARDIVAPPSPEARDRALVAAFLSPDAFRKFYEHYEGRILPEEEYLVNTLDRELKIPREYAKKFLEVFFESAKTANMLDTTVPGKTRLIPRKESAVQKATTTTPAGATVTARAPAVAATHSCFVLMPFGDFFDKYYSGVYEPAIRAAGMDPVRADGIFKSGQVIEQIWAGVQSSRVLLAELTGKNTNVFYELGLAHALGKPVILVASNIDDVPFDLRHLRVVVYDQRNPFWGEELKARVSEFLKAAAENPVEAMPDPFRPKKALPIHT